MFDMNNMVAGMKALGYLIIVGVISIPIIIFALVCLIKFIIWLTKRDEF